MTKKDKLKAQMSQQLQTSGFGDKSENTALISGDHVPEFVDLTLDQIHFSPVNPRKLVNPDFEGLKASIKAQGLRQKLKVTLFEGKYILIYGGNTRLRILNELVEEFPECQHLFNQRCEYVAFEKELSNEEVLAQMLLDNIVENDVRGEMTLIDKAVAAMDYKQRTEKISGEKLNYRDLANLLKDKGWAIDNSKLSIYGYAANQLATYVPEFLANGGGIPRIKEIRKLANNIKVFLENAELPKISVEASLDQFYRCLSKHDGENQMLRMAYDNWLTETASQGGHAYFSSATTIKSIIEFIDSEKHYPKDFIDGEMQKGRTTPPPLPIDEGAVNEPLELPPELPEAIAPATESTGIENEQLSEIQAQLKTQLQQPAGQSANEEQPLSVRCGARAYQALIPFYIPEMQPFVTVDDQEFPWFEFHEAHANAIPAAFMGWPFEAKYFMYRLLGLQVVSFTRMQKSQAEMGKAAINFGTNLSEIFESLHEHHYLELMGQANNHLEDFNSLQAIDQAMNTIINNRFILTGKAQWQG